MRKARTVLTIAVCILLGAISSDSESVPNAKLSVMGLAGGEEQAIAEELVRSNGFIEAECPSWRKQGISPPMCFSRSEGEKLALSFINGHLSMADYDFSLARYDGIRDNLIRQFGAPRPYRDGNDGSWVYDFWRNSDKTVEIDISKRTDGTGYITLDAVHLAQKTATTNPGVTPMRQQAHDVSDTECAVSSDDCIVMRVLSAKLVNMTTTDPNGYTVSRSLPFQRLTVSLRGKRTSDGVWFNGQNYRFADILCLKGCGRFLKIGETYRMRIGTQPTSSVPFIHPYLTLDKKNSATVQAWQLLELCPQGNRFQCTALSTVDDR
ncbi:hypothetical protein [Occallatibacter savannae]|uniref:hypothetical protein n=1 Tax=Occallatibacter savannae TaxID=1002691 RepID=UPI000D68A3B5|nr:hypothetical protein [Occallatibacter savannae]